MLLSISLNFEWKVKCGCQTNIMIEITNKITWTNSTNRAWLYHKIEQTSQILLITARIKSETVFKLGMVQSIKFDNRVTNCHRSHVNMWIVRLECRFHIRLPLGAHSGFFKCNHKSFKSSRKLWLNGRFFCILLNKLLIIRFI